MAFLLPILVVGLGMAVTVAPLTTAVIAISVFGALALRGALDDGIRLAMLVAALLFLLGAGCVVLTIRVGNQ